VESAKNDKYNCSSNPTGRVLAIMADYVMRAISKEKGKYKEEFAFEKREN
jgi:hypothetical protein